MRNKSDHARGQQQRRGEEKRNDEDKGEDGGAEGEEAKERGGQAGNDSQPSELPETMRSQHCFCLSFSIY